MFGVDVLPGVGFPANALLRYGHELPTGKLESGEAARSVAGHLFSAAREDLRTKAAPIVAPVNLAGGAQRWANSLENCAIPKG
jgi:hypothetical protein